MTRLVVLLVASASLAAVPAAAGAGHSSARSCGYIHASVPYSSHGHSDKWRVYVEGHASCATAVKVLDAVTHLHGRLHVGSSEVDTYSTYDGWLCPSGLMGEQTCELPSRLPDRPPIRAHALALDCATPGQTCPAQPPPSEL